MSRLNQNLFCPSVAQLDIESPQQFLRRCDNKKNQRWPTAVMFFDRSDVYLVLAQLDIEGNILTKIKIKRPVVLEEIR